MIEGLIWVGPTSPHWTRNGEVACGKKAHVVICEVFECCKYAYKAFENLGYCLFVFVLYIGLSSPVINFNGLSLEVEDVNILLLFN